MRRCLVGNLLSNLRTLISGFIALRRDKWSGNSEAKTGKKIKKILFRA